MKQYLDLLDYVADNGVHSGDRTGVGTYKCFGLRFEHFMQDGFPLLTTKKLHWKSIVHELLWFISGDTNIKYLNDNGVSIWDEWASGDGSLGPVYGKQWRDCGGVDQLQNAIDLINNDPNSRRIIVDAWHPPELKKMALTPCHFAFQFYCEGNTLSLQMHQRSCDLFLGVPFNIASYALLLEMVANLTNRVSHRLIITFGDIHIYTNHLEQAEKQLQRIPRTLPELLINKAESIDDYRFCDFELMGYDPHPGIKAEIAV